MIDVVIVGAGPAGLSAALVLGRSRKRVAVFDGGPVRNAVARGVHGVITRDGIPPGELRKLVQDELASYASVELHADTAVTAIVREPDRLVVHAGGREHAAHRVMLCTGLIDELPDIEGSAALWGNGLYGCPYCHGWEVRDRTLGFLSPDRDCLVWPRLLRSWSRDVIVFTSGAYPVPPDARRALDEAGIPVEERRVVGFERAGDELVAVRFDGGETRACQAMFVRPVQRQVPVVTALGVALDERGFVRVDGEQRTSIAGVYAAGDVVTHDHGAMTAAASGSRAAHCLNHELTVAMVQAGSL